MNRLGKKMGIILICILLLLTIPATITIIGFYHVINEELSLLAINDASVHIIEMNRQQNEFFLYDTNSTEFFSTGKSQNIDDFNSNYSEAKRHLDIVKAAFFADHPIVIEVNTLTAYLDTYAAAFINKTAYIHSQKENITKAKNDLIAAEAQLDKTVKNKTILRKLHEEQTIYLQTGTVEDRTQRGVGLNEVNTEIEKYNRTERLIAHSALNDYVNAYLVITKILNEVHYTHAQEIEAQFSLTQDRLNKLAEQETITIDNDIKNNFQRALGYIILATTIVVLFSILLFVVFFKSVLKPINEIKRGLERITKGDYEKKTEVNTNDELRDIANALNTASSALQTAKTERKKTENSKNTFIAMTSHELRSPMTPIKAQLQMLEGDYLGKLNKEQREAVAIALRNANHLDVVIQDLLEVSRIENARLSMVYAPTDLNKEVGLLIKGMSKYLPEKKIKLKLKTNVTSKIICDADRINQVLRNFITNAIKFSKKGGRVIITMEERKNDVLFGVKDFGAGIPQEQQEKVFMPFFQAENVYSREHGGTGLGLAINKGIIAIMGGLICFESKEGEGTGFYFTVPKNPPKQEIHLSLLQSRDERWKNLMSNIDEKNIEKK